MDKRRQELEERQDDLHLALLMDEYAEASGKEALEDADRAFESGEMAFSKEIDAACRAVIEGAPVQKAERKPARTSLRYALVAAATAVVMFGTLIIVQAAGIDVFGSIASWTDSVFHYNRTAEPETKLPDPEPVNEIQAALRDAGIPVELAPRKLPEGYEIAEVQDQSSGHIKVLGVYAFRDGSNDIRIIFEDNSFAKNRDGINWEKAEPSAQIFTVNQRSFYLFENEQGWSGTWSNGRYTVSYHGFATREELISTISSMGD